MTKMVLQHARTKKQYEIVKYDKETNIVTLKGEHGTFDETYDVPRFKRLGYTMVKQTAA